jgi:hypothetical protein
MTPTPLQLTFDYSCPYGQADTDLRWLPRLSLHVAGPAAGVSPVRVDAQLDTGADYSLFDGTVGLYLGWTEQDLAEKAEATSPVYGLGVGRGSLVGYLHRLRCFVPLGTRYAALELRVVLTPPNTLATPVLGRRDFFQQVDFAMVEAEQRFYLRFRDRSVLHASW